MLEQIAKGMMVLGAALAVAGAVLYGAARLGMGRLPGDVSFGGRGWRVYVPIGTCILLSILLSVVLWVISRLRK
jgi:hypothetical protein